MFENIECEWPLFFILFWLDGLISGDKHKVREYRSKLNRILPEPDQSGIIRIPELFYVPRDKVRSDCIDLNEGVGVVGGGACVIACTVHACMAAYETERMQCTFNQL